MSFAGGLRVRVVQDSFFYMMMNALEDLGWFQVGRWHSPITLVTEDFDTWVERLEGERTPIPPNVLSVSWGDYGNLDWEMGSSLAEHEMTGYVDFYAEDDSVGQHVIYDCAAIAEGRLTAIGRSENHFDVYDFTLATPTVAFRCEINNVVIDKARNIVKPWQKHWWSMQFVVTDFYATDAD